MACCEPREKGQRAPEKTRCHRGVPHRFLLLGAQKLLARAEEKGFTRGSGKAGVREVVGQPKIVLRLLRVPR